MEHPTTPSPPAGEPPRRIPSNRPLALFAHGMLLLGATAAVFLVVGTEQGSLGIFLVCAGVAMTLCPPRVRVDWRLWAAAGGIVASAALAFLPARWFHPPAWRVAIQAVPAITLPDSVSPVPWETGFWLAVLAISALAGLFALAHPLRTAGLVGLGSVAVVVCAVYTALAIYARETGWHYPYAGTATFGFFPNRNHTATFLVVGSILALGLLRVAWRDGRWPTTLLAGACLALFVAGLGYFSGSRGGIVFLLIGTLIWVCGLGRGQWNTPLLVSLATLLLAGGFLLLVSGSEVRNRLFPVLDGSKAKTAAAAAPGPVASANPADAENEPPDFRIFIYEDAARLVRDAPWTGAGLGAFAVVFPQYRQRSLNASAALHPESDWLMLAAEAGLPAVFAAGLLGWLLLRRSRRWRSQPSWPLRWACCAAVAAACLHGVVDVPIHRVVLGWWVLVLAGLGLHGGWSEDTARSRMQQACFVMGGLAALTLGASLIRAQWFGAAPLPPFAAGKAQEEIIALATRQEATAALEKAQAAVAATPMVAPLYYQQGVLLLHFEDTDAAVEDAFGAQRKLNPNWPSIPLTQGDAWIAVDPARTAPLWLEALDRQTQIARATASGEEASDAYYRSLLARAKSRPEIERGLAQAAARSPRLLLAWVEAASPATVRERMPAFTGEAALLDQFTAPQRERFLLGWYAKGDREALSRFVDEHPAWQPAAWGVRLRQLVDGQQFETAVREAAAHYQVSLALPAVTDPRDRHGVAGVTPDDPVQAFELFWREGNIVSARRILDEASRAPEVSPELWRLKAAWAAHDGTWPEAWDALRKFLRATNADLAIP